MSATARLDDVATGVAVIVVDERGENQIAVASGANAALTGAVVERARCDGRPGDRRSCCSATRCRRRRSRPAPRGARGRLAGDPQPRARARWPTGSTA